MVLVTLWVSVGVVAQTIQESRLNVGANPKKPANPSPEWFWMGGSKLPNKLNFNSKAEYTKFYRDLLLNASSNKTAEVVDNKPSVSKSSDLFAEKIKFGNIYPNPAVNQAVVPYEIHDSFKDARVTVMNLVGSSLLEYPVAANGKEVKINTSSLESGIYMVQFIVEGKKVGTKKLLVDRN